MRGQFVVVQIPYSPATLTLCEVEVYAYPEFYPNVSSLTTPPDISLDLSAASDGLYDSCVMLGNQTWTGDAVLRLGQASIPFQAVICKIYTIGINFNWKR